MSYFQLSYLTDQKMSPQLADDLTNLAGKVHAISHTPEPPPVTHAIISPPAATSTPEATTPPESAVTTLERKKRKAPKPPDAPKQATVVEGVEDLPAAPSPSVLSPSISSSSISSPTGASPMTKRQAPKVPIALSKPDPPGPEVEVPNDDDKLPPSFIPPPPPNEPPPDSVSSPVGPLSPKSLG